MNHGAAGQRPHCVRQSDRRSIYRQPPHLVGAAGHNHNRKAVWRPHLDAHVLRVVDLLQDARSPASDRDEEHDPGFGCAIADAGRDIAAVRRENEVAESGLIGDADAGCLAQPEASQFLMAGTVDCSITSALQI